MNELYSKSKRKNKQGAMLILGASIAQALGLFEAVGLDLALFGAGGFTLVGLLSTVGLGWVLWGIHKRRIA